MTVFKRNKMKKKKYVTKVKIYKKENHVKNRSKIGEPSVNYFRPDDFP